MLTSSVSHHHQHSPLDEREETDIGGDAIQHPCVKRGNTHWEGEKRNALRTNETCVIFSVWCSAFWIYLSRWLLWALLDVSDWVYTSSTTGTARPLPPRWASGEPVRKRSVEFPNLLIYAYAIYAVRPTACHYFGRPSLSSLNVAVPCGTARAHSDTHCTPWPVCNEFVHKLRKVFLGSEVGREYWSVFWIYSLLINSERAGNWDVDQVSRSIISWLCLIIPTRA